MPRSSIDTTCSRYLRIEYRISEMWMDEDPMNDYRTLYLEPYCPPPSIEEKGEEFSQIPTLSIYPASILPLITIQYSLPLNSWVGLKIYNPSGRAIKTLIEDEEKRGSRKIIWNGKDERGEKVPSGIYFVRLETPNYSATKKTIILRK